MKSAHAAQIVNSTKLFKKDTGSFLEFILMLRVLLKNYPVLLILIMLLLMKMKESSEVYGLVH